MIAHIYRFQVSSEEKPKLEMALCQNRELHDTETFQKGLGVFRLSEVNCNIPQVKTKDCVRFALLKQVLSLC